MSTTALKTHAPAAMRALRSRKTLDKVGTMLAVRVASTAVTKQIDIERPETIMWMRIVFVAVQLAAVAAFVYVLRQIRAKNDQTRIKTKPSRAFAKGKAIVLRVVTGKEQPPDPREHELVDTTICEHDAGQAMAAIKGIVRSMLLMGAVAVVLGWNKMLIAPVISRPVETVRHALFQLHILNAEPVGPLAREATPEEVAASNKAKAAALARVITGEPEKAPVANGNGKADVLDEKAALLAQDSVVVEKEVVEVAQVNGERDVLISEKVETAPLRQRRVVA